MIVKSPLPDVVLPEISFGEMVLQSLVKYGDAIAMVDVDNNGRTYTYSEIHNCVVRCASALHKLGVQPGDVVAISLMNRPEVVFAVIAGAICGATVTTCNPNYTEAEVVKQFSHSQPQLVFAENSGYDKMKAVAHQVPSIKHIFTAEAQKGCTSVNELIARADPRDFPHFIRPDLKESPFFLPYSSGTTGLPKGVMLTHANMVAVVILKMVSMRPSQNDTLYLVLPSFHIYGTMMTFVCLIAGTKLVLQRRFSVESFLRCVQEYKTRHHEDLIAKQQNVFRLLSSLENLDTPETEVTLVPAVPPMLLAVHNSSLLDKYDTSSLRKISSGAAPLPEGVGENVKKALKTSLVEGWGLTEAVPIVTCCFDDSPLKSIGAVVPNTSVKVVDPMTGKELGVGQDGEICCKGPQVMKGYYKNPEATMKCIDTDGWFHTGDIGHYDEIGQIYIVDRLKELIKVKGFQVAPAELEEILLRHPSVSDAAVVGVQHPVSGEAPKAFIVLKDKTTTDKDIHKFLEGRVSSYKYLKGGISFCDVIPKSASGKILRKELRALEVRKAKL